MKKATISVILLAAAGCATQQATAPAISSDATTIEVMVIGSFHMGNPGQDVANAEIGSMLTDQRQAEIAAAVNAIAAFKPTVIAVERITAEPGYVDPKFLEFTPDKLKSNADERYQLGYRLAQNEGVSRVYGIDEQPSDGEPDYFPFDELMAHAEATGQADALGAQITDIQSKSKKLEEMQKEKTVAELLIAMNSDPDMAGADFYYETFRYDRGEKQPGAELQAYWFMRNAKIFSKLVQVTKPGDRVVIIYGAGHKYWLDHFASHTPGFTRVDPIPYLQTAN